MDTSPLFDQETFTIPSEAPSAASFLERGIHCTRQGRYLEAKVLLEFARERLSPGQAQFAAALDAFIDSHTSCWQAQQELFMASKRLVEAETTHHTYLLALEKLLPTLEEDVCRASQPQAVAQPYSNTYGHQTIESVHLLPTDIHSQQLPVPPGSSSKDNQLLPALQITCFGHFEVRQSGKPVILCSSRSGQGILRYLAAQLDHCATSDTLMALFWPDDEPEVAQNKLHIAISILRRSLNQGCCGYIVYKNRTYYLNPSVSIRSDVDEFLDYYQRGQQAEDAKVTFYERACRLYTGPFLSEDMYADWSFLQREQLNRMYLAMCRVLVEHNFKVKHYEQAIKWAIAILKENPCDEPAHRQLIQIYAAQGYRSEALQQYQRCERLLLQELGVQPMPETQVIIQTILTSETTSPQR